VLTGANFQPAGSFRVPRGCFFPEPDVDSACITLVRRSKPILSPALLPPFRDLVKLAFSQRRKMMVKLLKARFDAGRLEAALNQLGLPPTVRAEAVSIEHFARLTELLHPAKP
jgi:16S rRNA (adenine1518-N6/adenine1519-N6)-dimethyltransferase